MKKMEQKLVQVSNNNEIEKNEYQVFELNGIKLDYFDIELALHGITAEILRYQASVREHPEFVNHRYNGMLHTVEEKFQYILKKMDRPLEDEERPAGYGVEV